MLRDMCLLFVKTVVVIIKSTVVPLNILHKCIVIAWIARTLQKILTSQLMQTADLAVTERTKRDFRCQFAAPPLVKPVVWFARAVVNWRSCSVAKSASADNTRALIHQELCLQGGLGWN